MHDWKVALLCRIASSAYMLIGQWMTCTKMGLATSIPHSGPNNILSRTMEYVMPYHNNGFTNVKQGFIS